MGRNFSSWTRKRFELEDKRRPQNSEIEILSNQGVRIEPVSRSHVKLAVVHPNQMRGGRKFHLEFEFKTTAHNGVLFYGRPHRKDDQLVAIVLINGYLMYKIKCPTMHASIFVQTGNKTTKLNDGRWHTVSYSVRKHGRKADITIDGYGNSKRYEMSCDHMDTIIMGGTSEMDKGLIYDLENIPGHFDGCIRKVRVPTALRSPPKYYAVSVCE